MSFEQGRLVTVTAGRGAGRVYAVLGCENGRVLLADGKTRLLTNPKRKSPRHLKVLDSVLPVQMLAHDKQLRTALAAYGNAGVQGG
jgi:ribosomal protein L14E/L6E/L27E